MPRSGGFFCAYPSPSRARSAVVRINEDDAGLFERAPNCLDRAWPDTTAALAKSLTDYPIARPCPFVDPKDVTVGCEDWMNRIKGHQVSYGGLVIPGPPPGFLFSRKLR